MPFTLRRTRRTELAPSRSLADVVRSTIGVNEKDEYEPCENHPRVAQPHLISSQDRTVNRKISRSVIRRAEFSHCQRAHRITQLPAELLAYIYVLGSEDDVRLPVVVSHVCRTWRAIALHTPSLWRHISLDSRRLMWTQRMQLAKACTLDVEIRPQASVGRRSLHRSYLDARTVESYMRLVSPVIYRWRSLRIEFQHYAPYLWNAALTACCSTRSSVQAPNLEHLELIHPLNDDPTEYPLFNGYAPRLRSAALHGVRLKWLPSLFANLISLDYTHHGFTRGQDAFLELFSMLQVCPKLEELRLSFAPRTHRATGSQSAQLPANARLHLTQLRALTLHVSAEDVPTALILLMSRLSLRGLRSLSLLSLPPPLPAPSRRRRDIIPPLPTPFSRLHSFFDALHRMPDLSYLRIAHSWVDAPLILSLLKFHVPRLRHLALASAGIDDAFLWTLGEELRGRYYVGHLEMDKHAPGGWHNGSVTPSTLGVLEVEEARVYGEGLIAVVRRMLSGGVLWVQEVRVKDCRWVESTVMERAQRFGVNVRMWVNDVEVRDGEMRAGGARPRRKESRWKRICR